MPVPPITTVLAFLCLGKFSSTQKPAFWGAQLWVLQYFYFLKTDPVFNLQKAHGTEQIREFGTEAGGAFNPWSIKQEM